MRAPLEFFPEGDTQIKWTQFKAETFAERVERRYARAVMQGDTDLPGERINIDYCALAASKQRGH